MSSRCFARSARSADVLRGRGSFSADLLLLLLLRSPRGLRLRLLRERRDPRRRFDERDRERLEERRCEERDLEWRRRSRPLRRLLPRRGERERDLLRDVGERERRLSLRESPCSLSLSVDLLLSPFSFEVGSLSSILDCAHKSKHAIRELVTQFHLIAANRMSHNKRRRTICAALMPASSSESMSSSAICACVISCCLWLSNGFRRPLFRSAQ